MILLRKKLALFLYKQQIGDKKTWEELPEFAQEICLKRADEIIDFFVDAIKKLEFKV
jgi:hypothetical protein